MIGLGVNGIGLVKDGASDVPFPVRYAEYLALAFDLAGPGEWLSIHDPQDITTMFQTRSMEPVTADSDPVGLILDKAQGLTRGSEMVADTNFNNAGSWTLSGGCTVSGGLLTCVGTGTCISASTPVVHGMWYEITYEITRSVGAGGVYYHTGTASIYTGTVRNAVGTYRELWPATAASNVSLRFTAEAGADLDITLLSCKALPGAHWFMATAGARPLYKTNGVRAWLSLDGVDDGIFGSSQPQLVFDAPAYIATAIRRRFTSAGAQGFICLRDGTPSNLSIIGVNDSTTKLIRAGLRIASGTSYNLDSGSTALDVESVGVLSTLHKSLLLDQVSNGVSVSQATTYTTEVSGNISYGLRTSSQTFSRKQDWYGAVMLLGDPGSKRAPLEAAMKLMAGN